MNQADPEQGRPNDAGPAIWGATYAGPSLGTELRSERILQGKTLEGVAAALRIRRDQLAAIEDGDYKRLPGAPYAIGFVRSYAEYLGFDGASAIARFKAEAELPDPAELNFPEPVAEAKAPTGRILAGSIVLLVAIYLGFSYADRSDVAVVERIPPLPVELMPPPPPPVVAAAPQAPVAAPVAPQPVAPAAPVATAAVEAAPATSWRDAAAATTEGATLPEAPPVASDRVASIEPAPAPGAAALPGTGDSRIVLHAERDSWIQIQGRNNEVLASKVLRAGDTLVVPNQPGARLTTGNAGGLEILVDGRPVQRLGADGAVVRNISLDPVHLTTRITN